MKLDENMMKYLSFPDYEVEKIIFSPDEKSLMIFVEGAWLDTNNGKPLGKGVLFFNDWEELSISRFDPSTKKWVEIDKYIIEPLSDICEVNFFDSSISLYGFGKHIGHWMECKIYKTKMYAEFNS